MPGGSKNTGSTTSTTSMPLVNDILPWAKGVVTNSGPGGAWKPNTTSMVTPFSKQTMSGLTGLQNTANNSTGAFTDNFNRINATLKDGGLNTLQDQQVSRFDQIAHGNGLNTQQQTAYNRLDPIAGGNGYNADQQNAVNLLNPIAQGKGMQNNPYLEDVIKRSSQDIAGANALTASGAGRYGSGMAQDVTQRNIGDMSSNLRFNDYNNQQGRQDAAIQNLFGMGSQGLAQKTGAINSQFGIGTTGQNQRTNAIGSLFNAGTQQRQNVLNGTQQLSDAYGARKSPYQDLLNIGGMYENKNNQLLQDQSRIFNEKKNAQLGPLNWLSDLASRFQGGSTTTNYQQPSNPFGGGIGGFLSGYGLTGSPLGGLFGGLGGAFL